MPEENQPGHHPDQEQDKPDPDVFAARAQGKARQSEPVYLTIMLVPLRLSLNGLRWAGRQVHGRLVRR